MRVDVVLPTYNGERFLRAQIDSILAQTHSDLLLTVVDDGSSDGTVAIVDDYVARDPRVRRLPATGNKGQTARLQELIRVGTSDFLAIADQDDVWAPDRNERLLDAIGDRALAFGRSQLIDGSGHDLGRSLLEDLRIDPEGAGALGTLFRPLVSAHSAIVRRNWLDRNAFGATTPFDWLMSAEALLSSGLAFDREAVVFHRIHGGNQMNSIARRSRRRISRSRFVDAVTFVGADRRRFVAMLHDLSRSCAVPRDVAAVFGEAERACIAAWREKRFPPTSPTRLADALHRLLAPFASSAQDLQTFSDRVRSLTRWQFGLTNMAVGLERYQS